MLGIKLFKKFSIYDIYKSLEGLNLTFKFLRSQREEENNNSIQIFFFKIKWEILEVCIQFRRLVYSRRKKYLLLYECSFEIQYVVIELQNFYDESFLEFLNVEI